MTIIIKVGRMTSDGKVKPLYQNSVLNSNAVNFDFAAVYRVLKILYPNSNVIEFLLNN